MFHYTLLAYNFTNGYFYSKTTWSIILLEYILFVFFMSFVLLLHLLNAHILSNCVKEAIAKKKKCLEIIKTVFLK